MAIDASRSCPLRGPRSSAPRRAGLLAAAVLLAAAAPGRADDTAPRLPLWNGKAPVGQPREGAAADSSAETEAADAFITVHLPAAQAGGGPAARTPAAVICPGGGYGGLVTGAEGHGIAAWLGRHGIAGIVLEYRLPKGRSFVPIADASRALRTVRARAEEWRIDPRRVGVVGFSAGGHLASTAATMFDDGDPQAADPVARQSSRPDFAILVYPVITMRDGGHAGSRKNLLGESPEAALVERFSNEMQVTPRTPPTFLAHAVDDRPVPIGNSRVFHEACVRAGVKSRLLELPSGGHGLDGYKGPNWDAWQSAAIEWLASLGMAHAPPPAVPAAPASPVPASR
jgi:acetyl esterase/lipase